MAAATMYVTTAGAGAKDGAAWASAMGYAEWETDVEASAEAGDIYYVAGGTYTLTSDFLTILDGTAVAPIKIIGVNSGTTNEPPVAADWATGDNRPLITDTTNAYTFTFNNYWEIRNIRITGSDIDGIRADTGSLIENCKVSNDSVAERAAISSGGQAKIVNCEAICTNGNAIGAGANNTVVEFCYLHDSKTGINCNGTDNFFIAFNIIDTVSSYGVNTGNSALHLVITNNTIYSGTAKGVGTIGIYAGTTCTNYTVTHNIITDFETGVSFGDTSSNSGYFNYNDYYDNTTDRVNTPTGNNDVDVNPEFTTPGSDFSLQSTSDLINAGIDLLGT